LPGYDVDPIEVEEGIIWGVEGNRLIIGLDKGVLSYSRYRLAEEELRFSIIASPVESNIQPGSNQDTFPDLSESAIFNSFYEPDNASDQTGDNNTVDITAVRATNFVPDLVSANNEDSIEEVLKAVDKDLDGITDEFDHFPLDVLRSSNATNYELQSYGSSVCVNKICVRLSTSDDIYDGFSHHVYSNIETTAQFAPGGSFSCTLESSNVDCKGSNTWGQLDVPELENPTHIAVGGTHACAKTDQGIKCWGNSDRRTSPPRDLGEVKKLVAGSYYSCALLTAGGVRCWGDAGFIEPYWISRSNRFTDIFSSDFAICALDNEATPYCWGWNSYLDFIPDNLSGVTKLTLENEHACALYQAGEMECWGNGQTSIPDDIITPQNIVAVSHYTCAQTQELLRCWGVSPFTDKAMDVYLGVLGTFPPLKT